MCNILLPILKKLGAKNPKYLQIVTITGIRVHHDDSKVWSGFESVVTMIGKKAGKLFLMLRRKPLLIIFSNFAK